MAITITGEYTDATTYRIKVTGLTVGARYRLFVRDYNSDGSYTGYWYCHYAANSPDGVIDYRYRYNCGYSGARTVRLYQGTSGSYDAGNLYSSLPTSDTLTSGSIPKYTPPVVVWYGLTLSCGDGISSFRGYKVSAGSGTDSSYARYSTNASTSGEKFYISSISPDSGYTYPIYATDGTNTWVVKNSAGDTGWSDHYVSFSSSANTYRGVTLYASEKVAHTLHIYFDEHVQSITFTNGDTVTYDPRAPYGISYNYTGDVVIDASQTGWKAGWGNFTGTVYWGTSSGSTSYTIGEYSMGSRTSSGSLSNRTISYTSATDRYIYITASGVTYYTIKIDPNGGSVSGHTATYTVSSAWEGGTDYTLPSESAGSYSGKKLTGFTLYSTSGTFYSAGSPVTITGNCTFYAVWENNTFWGRIAYMTTLGTVLPQYSTPISRLGKGYKDDTIYGTASAVGYDFAGWTEARHDPDTYFGTIYKQGDTYPLYCTGESSDSPRNNYLWAYFTKGPTTYYGRLVYKGNGGTFSGGETQIKSGLYSAESILPGAPTKITISPAQTPTRTGYTFNGWKDSDGNTLVVGQSYDFVLYGTESSPTEFSILAQWTKNTYTLTLDANGGQFGTLGPTTKTVSAEYGSSVSLSLYNPTRNKYKHTGWQTSEGTTYSTTDSITITGDITLYAVWSRETIAKFYWDGNTGSTDATLFASGRIVKNNLTASRWNAFRAKIKELADALGISYSYSSVSANSKVTASDFNNARNGINSLTGHGTIPSAKAKGDVVQASLYNGNTSLKNGLNTAIDNYNNTD